MPSNAYINPFSFLSDDEYKKLEELWLNQKWDTIKWSSSFRVDYQKDVPPSIRLELRPLRIFYIASVKNGYANATTKQSIESFYDWDILFTERSLREWFKDWNWENLTRYEVLGISSKATDNEVIAAYRKLVRQWHPDVNPDPEAKDKFIYLTETRDLLLNENKRARYDAGLFLQKQTDSEQKFLTSTFTPPVKCGIITAKIRYEEGCKPTVEEIHEWKDIIVNNQQTISGWDREADNITLIYRDIPHHGFGKVYK